jgi:hypothetical protein
VTFTSRQSANWEEAYLEAIVEAAKINQVKFVAELVLWAAHKIVIVKA